MYLLDRKCSEDVACGIIAEAHGNVTFIYDQGTITLTTLKTILSISEKLNIYSPQTTRFGNAFAPPACDNRTNMLRLAMELITENGFHRSAPAMIVVDTDVGAGPLYRY